MGKLGILVVDDSVLMRRLLSDVLSSDPTLQVLGSAATGSIALAKVSHFNPDLVILNTAMESGEGLQTLTALHKAHPRLPIIAFAPVTDQTSSAALDVLTLGAHDYVARPADIRNSEAIAYVVRNALIPKIAVYSNVATARQTSSAVKLERMKTAAGSLDRVQRMLSHRTDILVIGVSTGGPNALAELLGDLPGNFPIPVLIVQHMLPMFTDMLVDRLDKTCAIGVSLGISGAILRPGHAWMAPGDFHMTVQQHENAIRIQTNQDPPENSCRPSVDVLFRSAAEVYGRHVLAVVMTGMGQDGLRGCEQIHDAGGLIFVQDEASSVVWGMPGFVARAGLADKVLPLRQLGSEIVNSVWKHRPVSSSLKSHA